MNIDFTGLVFIALTGLGALIGLVVAVPIGGAAWAVWDFNTALNVAMVCLGIGTIFGGMCGLIAEMRG